MGECCLLLMEKYHARFGYTQSDEMCILIPPASVVRGEQQGHDHAGRVQKLGTQACSFVTATYNFLLSQKMAERGLNPLEAMNLNVLPTFDCRVGIYPDARAAYALVFWRAYDCSVNSISDAVFHSKLPGFKQMVKRSTVEKV
jgi:tRNA(His) 5'-end guanylyltransferase